MRWRISSAAAWLSERVWKEVEQNGITWSGTNNPSAKSVAPVMLSMCRTNLKNERKCCDTSPSRSVRYIDSISSFAFRASSYCLNSSFGSQCRNIYAHVMLRLRHLRHCDTCDTFYEPRNRDGLPCFSLVCRFATLYSGYRLC